jgi:hypothetical protein
MMNGDFTEEAMCSLDVGNPAVLAALDNVSHIFDVRTLQ